MAWTDQCRIAFRTNAEGIIHNQRKGVRETLHELSVDSGIPYGTLRRWFYRKEQSVPKTGNTIPVKTQEQVWRNVLRRMEHLAGYMEENIQLDDTEEFTPEMKAAFLQVFERLELTWVL